MKFKLKELKKTKIITVRVDYDKYIQFKKMAESWGETISTAINDMIDETLNDPENQKLSKKKR